MANRRWLLAKRPDGAVSEDCFAYEELARDEAGGAPGQVLLRIELLLCAPTIRNWISGERSSYYPTIELGEAVRAPALGRVVVSHNPDYPVGTRLLGFGAWQDELWIDPAQFNRVADGISSVDAMGIFGLNAMTAYFGLLEVGKPQPGEILLVSGAAGSVGSIVAQIGRIKGCRVIALCSGGDKAQWLRDECGITEVIDYKHEDVPARIDALAPDGIDVYYDNVGGPLLADVVKRMRPFGRIALCGQIATYDDGGDMLGPRMDMMRMIYGGITMRGFLARHFAAQFPQAVKDLAEWDRQGLLRHREDVRDGMANLPSTFRDLFKGANKGTLLARISDDQGNPL